MTGWPAVAATTGLMVVALTGFNVRLYRRMKAAAGEKSTLAQRGRTDAP